MTSFQMSTYTYDQLFEALLGASVCGIVLSALWIVWILIAIEANKNAFYSVNVDVHGGHSLEMQEETSGENNGMEVEPAPKSNPSSPTSSLSLTSSSSMANNKKRPRRVKASYKLMQFASVSVLLLLTYLLLVVTDAPLWASAIGSLCVFGIFLRYQIGDELRRQRIDRIALMLSLFLFIASLMSLCTYAFKSLGNGEIYEGPARIVGYDQTGYNNSAHDPSTRTDLEVQWGKDWGCPLSGGKVCQAIVQGAMCTVNLESDGNRRRQQRRRRNRRHQRRFLADDAAASAAAENESSTEAIQDTNTTETAANSNVDGDGDNTTEELEEENQELETENEQLQKEVEELKLENQEEEEVATEEVEEVEEEEVEDEAIYDEDIETVEEEELEIEEEYTDAYVDVEEEEIKVEEEYATDPDAVEEDEATIDELEDEKTEIDQVYEEYEDQYETNAEDYASQAEDAEAEEDEIKEEEEETKEEYEVAEEEIEDGMEDDWYWEEITYEYDDDMYDTEYWAYDWSSAWGEYACEDLFDGDMAGINYDTSIPAGEDDYPYINIYGSCKTCEAYILDYFAEEAFESVEEHKQLAILYMTGAMTGFIFSFVAFIKYKVNPPAENEIELLGSDGGVLA